MGKIPKFEIGDRLKPLSDKTSNYYNLKSLCEVKVLNNDIYPTHSRKFMKVEIVKGSTFSTQYNYGETSVGRTIEVYEDAFEKVYDEPEDYSIF